MKIVRHPNIVRLNEVRGVPQRSVQCLQFSICFAYLIVLLYWNCIPTNSSPSIYHQLVFFLHQQYFITLQVLAGKTKIYIVLELVTGGELFDRIVRISCSMTSPIRQLKYLFLRYVHHIFLADMYGIRIYNFHIKIYLHLTPYKKKYDFSKATTFARDKYAAQIWKKWVLHEPRRLQVTSMLRRNKHRNSQWRISEPGC